MPTLIYWFRNDLRLADNPAFTLACRQAVAQNLPLLPVFCHAPPETTRWGFARVGPHRQRVLADTLADLHAQLQSLGSALLQVQGPVADTLPALARLMQTRAVVAEDIAAPYEEAEVAALQSAGLTVHTVWQSSLLDPSELPFEVAQLPAVFTQFRSRVEKAGVQPRQPLPVPTCVPPLPASADLEDFYIKNKPLALADKGLAAMNTDVLDKASVPFHQSAFQGGERAGLAHVRRYMAAKLPHSYKTTRNQLSGTDYSSKFSPWLASGALSACTIYAQLKTFEAEFGANDGSYWLRFELLWRDYFRFLHLQYGAALYHARGLRQLDADQAAASLSRSTERHQSRSQAAVLPVGSATNSSTKRVNAFQTKALQRWCQGQTGEPLIDAAMHELHSTGYLSNRLRQVVASYLIYDLGGDWRAGAAWFESQLIDFDIYSNQGNWLYIAGLGTDPRGGRRFNPAKQTQDHDPDGHYRRLWSPLTA